MYSVPGDTTSLVPGFPIRTSSDQRSVGSSPRLIAASYVLHRLPVPRHPPCALKHLQRYFCTKKLCTNQFGKIAHQTTTNTLRKRSCSRFDARNHYPQIKHHTPPPKRGDNQSDPTTAGPPPEEGTGLLSQSPIVCLAFPPARIPAAGRLSCTRTPPTTGEAHPTNRSQHRTPTICGRV